MSEQFSEADLEPSADDRRRARDHVIDRAAAVLGIVSAALVVGGMLALGACAAPAVFQLAPDPYSGNAMGTAFARFDRLAIGASCAAMGAEVVRTYLTRRARPRLWARIRRLVGIGLAGCATVMGAYITPEINDLHAQGVHRGEGELGARLEATHKKAESLGKLEVALGVALMGLHVFTIRDRRDDEDEEDEEEVQAPAPPGPKG